MTLSFRLLLVLVASFALPLVMAVDELPKLPRSLQREVEETLRPAVGQNNFHVVARTAADLLRRAGLSQAESLDEFLRTKGLPDCRSLLLDARMKIEFRGLNNKERSKGRVLTSEVRPLFETLNARLAELKAGSSAGLTVDDFHRTEGTFRDYAVFLRDVYREGSKQQQIIHLCSFANRFIEKEKRTIERIDDPEIKDLCNVQRFLEDRGEAQRRFYQLVDTEHELRLQRLQKASEVLASMDAEPAERFTAAFPARLDASYLPQALADKGVAEDSDQAVALQQLVDRVRRDAGPLWDRSHRFYVGFDWWRRGRFGRGQYAGGMMKGFDALQSLNQQIALNMPEEFPEVTSASQSSVRGEQYPLSRRHKYHWQFEPPRGSEFKVRKWFG